MSKQEPSDLFDPAANDSASAEFEVVDDNPFFAPTSTDLLDPLLGQYQAQRQHIERLASIVHGSDLGGVVGYFIEGNAGDEKLHRSIYVDKLFAVPGAIGALNSAFWSKALALTDVYAMMPQDRKNQWNEQLRNPLGKEKRHQSYEKYEAQQQGRTLPKWEIEPLPDFEPETVRATIDSLLHARAQFLAERVDGIFRNLSGEHVTNAPEAFGKRMIVAHVLDGFGSTNHTRAGYLHDLRCVIAKFMGREEPANWGATDQLINKAKARSGQWIVVDGGALKLRVYKVGTAHLEVHPDMAWRLNQILAHMHPLAIPAEFRQRPKRKPKNVELMRTPLPFAVLSLISEMRCGLEKTEDMHRAQNVPNSRQFQYGDKDKHTLAAASRVIESIGGVLVEGRYFKFDYDPTDVLFEIITSGCIPDQSSHQFYATPETIAREAAELADIGDAHTVLEPSAGHGDLAAHLPKDRTTCVEVSALRCAVLKAKGFATVQSDFTEWAIGAPSFDRIVMNPPFSEGRWKAHAEAAAGLVKPGGVLVAVLPASARNAFTLPGFACEWSRLFADEFAGTSVSVVILKATRAA